MTYDSWKLSTPPEYDTLGQDPADGEVECIHGVDLFAPCAKCKPMAANGGEENDDMGYHDDRNDEAVPQADGDRYFTCPLDQYTPYELAAMASRIEAQLDRFEEMAKKLAKDVEQARAGKTKPRATRSDAGRPRQKPANEVARDEKGVAV